MEKKKELLNFLKNYLVDMRDEKYKESNVKWIGLIPESWNCTAIKHILSIPITDGPHTTPELVEDGIPFISAEAIKNGKIDFSRKRGDITPEDYELFSKKYIPKCGDIYMVKSGATTGNVAMLEVDYKFTIWSPLAVFRANQKKVLPKYLHYYLQSSNLKYGVELSWSYGTQQNIGMGVLSNLSISYPSLPEQTQIARYLDHQCAIIDALIEKKEKLIELLKEKRQSIINEAVTKGLNPKAKMKDSGIEWLGEIPENWDIVMLRYLNEKIGSGVTPKGGAEVYVDEGAVFIRSQNVHFDGLRLDDVVRIDWDTHNKMSATRVLVNDVLLNITGASIGRSCVVKIQDEMNVNQHVCIIRPNAKVNADFLNLVLQSFVGQTQIKLLTTGGNREGLTFEAIREFNIPVPNVSTQNVIVEAIMNSIDKFEKAVIMNKALIEKLKEYRQSIISEAVTGKVDVRDWEPVN